MHVVVLSDRRGVHQQRRSTQSICRARFDAGDIRKSARQSDRSLAVPGDDDCNRFRPCTDGCDDGRRCAARAKYNHACATRLRTAERSGRRVKSSNIGVITPESPVIEPECVDGSHSCRERRKLVASVVHRDLERNRNVARAVHLAKLMEDVWQLGFSYINRLVRKRNAGGYERRILEYR